MITTTYSFSDVIAVISHPLIPAFTINGVGVGSITVTRTDNNTSHDTAADGSVMVSKIISNKGTVDITVQQTSPLDQWFRNQFFNRLYLLPSDQWALAYMSITALRGTQKNMQITGVSPAKPADLPFQAEGQQVTWNLMAADIQTLL